MYMGDGKLIAHAQYWEQVVALIKGRRGDTYVTHVKAHQKTGSEEGLWNKRADVLAKQGALLTQSKEEEVISVVTRTQKQVTSPEMLDLQTLQEGDEEIKQLLKQKTIRGKWHVQKDPQGVVWVTKHDSDLGKQPTRLLVPKKVRTELIQYMHEQGHFGVDKTLETVKATGWWPEGRCKAMV
ncbi:unnamed protein product [Natator depressus]